MPGNVVDASALAAVIFDETGAEPVIAMVQGALHAPTLLRYELASVCTSKIRQNPGRSNEIHRRHRLLEQLCISLHEPDWAALPTLAVSHSLSAYDAAYLQLAVKLGAPLITLDAKLAKAYDTLAGGRLVTR
ncbi:MAG: type II toxin-antitoxin system VapC family toxin [Steroidobacteraceae bacterium]